MRILKALQPGVLERPFSYSGRHFLCVSLLWCFNLREGSAELETDMWQALGGLFAQGRVFDQGMPKDRAEFLCAGSFHAPDGRPVRQEAVSARVGEIRKRLLVSGPRYWRAGVATRPEPITTCPISYNEAFGGASFPDNMSGKGHGADETDEHPLPCVEYPGEALTSPSQTPRPASLEGRDMQWRSRQRYAGTYDEAYIRNRMPGLPDDVDWRVFNDGAEDQWFPGFLRGDEDFELVHMHPEEPRLEGHLPGVLGRAFIERKVDPGRADSELEFREIPLRLDTVWLLPDADLGVVIHRGTTEIATDDATDVVNLLAAHENLRDERRSRDHYRDEMRRRGDPDEGYRYMLDTRALLPSDCACALQQMMEKDDSGRENLAVKNMATYSDHQREEATKVIDERGDALREQLQANEEQLPSEATNLDTYLENAKKAFGDEPQKSEQNEEIQRIIEKIIPGAGTGGDIDITRINFDGFDELNEYARNMAAEREEELERTLRERIAELRRQNDPPSDDLTRAIAAAEEALEKLGRPASPLPRPAVDVSVSQIREQIAAVEQYREELEAGGVDPGQISAAIPDFGPIRDQLVEAEQAVTEQYRVWAHYVGPSLSPHPGEEQERRARLLALAPGQSPAGDRDFAFIDLSGVTLRKLDLSGAYLEYVDFTGATLVDIDLTGAILAKARLRDCNFDNVTLRDANIGSTDIANASFTDCDMTQARFSRARIADTKLQRCRLRERPEMFLETVFDRVTFDTCDMREMIFLQNDLGRCAFRGSDLSDSHIVQADLTHADFTRSKLNATNIVSTPAPGACFDGAEMDNVRFIDQPVLNDCSFQGASLTGANLRDADLCGARFTGAVLTGSDFDQADLSDARIDRVRAIGTQFRKVELGGAVFHRSDLREASLMKARMQRTRFTDANLYSVSFLYSTLGETEFGGANMDNTILRDWRPRGG